MFTPSQRRRVEAMAELLGTNVADQVRGAVGVPLTWQSKQVTPVLGFKDRRSSVALNCCCGNGVTSSRRPSNCFGFNSPLNNLK